MTDRIDSQTEMDREDVDKSARDRRTPVSLDPCHDRVALVTGATGAIGRAIVEELLGRGWAVVASDLGEGKAFDRASSRLRYVQSDVRDKDAMASAVEAASELGALRGCVANAGIVAENFAPFLEASPDAWARTFEVNVLGVLTTLQAAARRILENGGGRLAVTASVAGLRAEADLVAYSASKAATISIVRSLALDLGHGGISVNAVAPGPVETELQHGVIESRSANEGFAGRYERFRGATRPFARLTTPAEVSGVFGWLFSDAAAYITGQTIAVDGGGILT